MSKVPYTVNVDEYICSALEQMRKMNETRDYSGLAAAIERVQHHANMMERGLDRGQDFRWSLARILGKDNPSVEDIKAAFVKYYPEDLKDE